MGVLHSIDHTHVLGAFVVGIVAGIVAFALDTYVIARVEAMAGITPGVL
jgi:hypothetical protein